MILGFKDQFVPYIDGTKTHTIRANNRWRAGMRTDLFARPRQKGMRLLFRAPVLRVEPICIDYGGPFRAEGKPVLSVTIGEAMLDEAEAEAFFVRDGFRASYKGSAIIAAYDFWRDRLPFCGQIIHWDYDAREEGRDGA